MTEVSRLVRRSVAIVAGTLLLVALAYVAAGLTGGAIPVNAAWRPPDRGVTIWVEGNGIHTGIVVPKVAAGVDWRGWAPAGDLRDARYGDWGYLTIGWGEHDFYLGTPTWRDLRPGTVLAAITGSDATLLHVEHRPHPVAGDDVRAVVLRPDEYRRLVAFIVATRRPGGSAAGARWPGYGPDDVFYAARGRYDAARTCNAWTGQALRAAGVRVGWWTPFPATVMAWFA